MFKAIDPNAVRIYKSPKDPDPANATVFHLGVLDPAVRDFIDNKCMNIVMTGNDKNSERKFNINTMQHSMMIVRFGLRGVDGWMDKDGTTPISVRLGTTNINGKAYQTFPEDLIPMLGSDLIQELAEEILTGQFLSEEFKKN